MFETTEERKKWLKNGMKIKKIEELYLISNGIGIVRWNLCSERMKGR
jgi:hypothetical protein